MKTADEILLEKFPLLPKSSDKKGIELIILAMHEYATLRTAKLTELSETRGELLEHYEKPMYEWDYIFVINPLHDRIDQLVKELNK
jgi:hypothetical protein